MSALNTPGGTDLTSTLVATGKFSFPVTTVLAGTSNYSADSKLYLSANAALVGSSSLTAILTSSATAWDGSALLQGTGLLTGSSQRFSTTAAVLSASSSLASIGTFPLTAAAVLSASSSLASKGTFPLSAIATLPASGSSIADSKLYLRASAALIGSGLLAAITSLSHKDSITLFGSGLLAANTSVSRRANAQLAGSGSVRAATTFIKIAIARLQGSGSLIATAIPGVVPGWPSSVPQFAIIDSYTEKTEGNIATFTPEIGPPKRRRRMSRSSAALNFDTYMTSDEVASFLTFYKTDLKDGTELFSRRHPRRQDRTDFKFVAVPTIAHISVQNYRVSLSMREAE